MLLWKLPRRAWSRKDFQAVIIRWAVFTNLTQDHLDVHGTMENYYQAKKILFTISDNAIINIDDEYGRRYLKEISCPAKTYSCCTKADFRAEDILLSASGVKYVFTDGKIKHNVSFNMPGLFNVSNSLAVIAAVRPLDLTLTRLSELWVLCRA